MSERKSWFEKAMTVSNAISIGLLGIAIVTASNVLAMASAVDIASNAIISHEYKKRKNKKPAK